MSGCGCEKPLDGVVEGVLVCLACGGALTPVSTQSAAPERSGRRRRLKRRSAAAPADTPWPERSAEAVVPVVPDIETPVAPAPFVATLDAYTGATEAHEPEIEIPVAEVPESEVAEPEGEAEVEVEVPEPAVEVDLPEPEGAVEAAVPEPEVQTEVAEATSLDAYALHASAPAPVEDAPVEVVAESVPWSALPTATVEAAASASDELEPTKPWFDVPVQANAHEPEAAVDEPAAVEEAPPDTPISEPVPFDTQPWNDPPAARPTYDHEPEPSRWTEDVPVAELPRAYEPAPTPKPWTEAPAASAMPHPYETARETWTDAAPAAVAVDTLVEPPSIDTSFPEPPERFSGAPPMPPGMRAPGPKAGEPVTPESFMDPRVSFKRRHPLRRVLILVLVLGLAGGAGYWWVNHNQPNPRAASAGAFLNGDGTVSNPPGTHFRVRFPIPPATVADPKATMVGLGGATVKVSQYASIASTTGFGMSVRELDYTSAIPAAQADALLGGIARHFDSVLPESVTYAHSTVDGHRALRTFAHLKLGGLERRELYLLVGHRVYVVSVNAKQNDTQLFAAVVKSFKTTN